MKNAEIKELSIQELMDKIEAEKKALNQMEINHSISPLDNPTQIKLRRRMIARMNTEVRHREINKQ